MSELEQLERARRVDAYRLRFAGELETEFRRSHRARYRLPRLILFAIGAMGFGLAPLFLELLWLPTTTIRPLLLPIVMGLVLPAVLVALVATALRGGSRMLVETAQSIGILGFWGGVLLLRYFALRGEMNFPPEMLGVAIVAVSVFGGFDSRRVIPTALAFCGLGIFLELHYASSFAQTGSTVLSLCYMGLIAAAGSYTHELLGRIAWATARYAYASARSDPLTGLATRAEFNRLLPRVLAQAAREQRMVAVALLDVDHFKRINDTQGHLFGDQVLRRIGGVLQQLAGRPLDLRARYGGEEFVLVWYDITPLEFEHQMSNLLYMIRETTLENPRLRQEIPLSASIGGIWLVPPAGQEAEPLLQDADQRLYEAKAAGRDCARLQAAEQFHPHEHVVQGDFGRRQS
ncbi:MAG TPA: GGDEF domain-containing protein [Solimonas sp.]